MKSKIAAFTILLIIGMSFHTLPVQAQDSRNIASNLFIKPGKMAVGRLRNVPDNVDISVAVSSKGPIWIYIVNEVGFKNYPKIKNPLVMAHVFSALHLTTRLEKGGNYYILFQNRHPSKTVTANFFTKIKRGEGE